MIDGTSGPTLVIVAFGAAVGVGCNPSADGGDEQEHLGEVAQAVYPGCETVSYDDTIGSNYCSAEWSDAPSASYDHGASCPDRWVVEFTGTLSAISAWGRDGWADTVPTTYADCLQARWESDGYEYDGTSWTEIGKVTGQGWWNGGSCSFIWDDQFADPVESGQTKVRVATYAYAHTRSGDIKKKARSWVIGSGCD